MGVVVNFNAATVDPSVQPEALETGRYPVAIVSSEEKETKDRQGRMLILTNQVISGPMAGRKIIDRLNTHNANTEAVRIAWATFSAICHVTGRLNVGNTQELHGAPYVIDVIKVPRNDKPGAFSNDIVGYFDSQGKPPVKGQPGNSTGGGGDSSGEWGGDAGGSTSGGEPDWNNETSTQQSSAATTTQQAGQVDAEAAIRAKVEAEMKMKAEIEAKVRAEMAAKAGGTSQQAAATTDTATAAGDGSVPDWAK